MRNIIINVLGTYTPSGDSFGGADWTFIFGGILLVCTFYWVLKFLFSLFK